MKVLKSTKGVRAIRSDVKAQERRRALSLAEHVVKPKPIDPPEEKHAVLKELGFAEPKISAAQAKELVNLGWTDSIPPLPAEATVEVKRERYKNDFMAFYQEVYAAKATFTRGDEKTPYAQCLGLIHRLMIDFVTFSELDHLVTHSPLESLLPKKVNGKYCERWIYWRVLSQAPEIQDGPEGPISSLFYGAKGYPINWHGVIIRICGDGRKKCGLVPRGFLKSELWTKAQTLWRLTRDKALRVMIRCIVAETLAHPFVNEIRQKMNSQRFKTFFPDYETKRVAGGFFIQGVEDKRGSDPNVIGLGINSEATGKHFDRLVMDDLIAESNSKDAAMVEEARLSVEAIEGAVDPGAAVDDYGTKWDEYDPHWLFTSKSAKQSQDCSFLVASVLDADSNGDCVGIAGRGNSMWPEKFDKEEIERRLRAISNQRLRYGQYFNQLRGTRAKVFHPQWINEYAGEPESLFHPTAAFKHGAKLPFNITIGLQVSANPENFSAAFALGQTRDYTTFFVLDGFCERLPADLMAAKIVKFCCHWHKFANLRTGVFAVAANADEYEKFLQPGIAREQRERGVESVFFIRPVVATPAELDQSIANMAESYSRGRILWPKSRAVEAIGDPYDFIELLREQLTNYPSVLQRALLDAHAKAFEIAPKAEFKKEATGEAKTIHADTYSRDGELEPANSGAPVAVWKEETEGYTAV